MPLVSTTVVGRSKVEAKLDMIRRAVQNLRPFWNDEFAPRYFGQVQDRFAIGGMTRGDRGRFNSGTKWAPLSPRYAAWKARHFPDKPILVREELLRESLKWNGHGLGRYGIWEPGPKGVRLGTSRPGASAHMTGTRYMPARRFMEPPDKGVFAPLLQAWLRRQAGARTANRVQT